MPASPGFWRHVLRIPEGFRKTVKGRHSPRQGQGLESEECQHATTCSAGLLTISNCHRGKLDFLIVGLPWHEAELLSETYSRVAGRHSCGRDRRQPAAVQHQLSIPEFQNHGPHPGRCHLGTSIALSADQRTLLADLIASRTTPRSAFNGGVRWFRSLRGRIERQASSKGGALCGRDPAHGGGDPGDFPAGDDTSICPHYLFGQALEAAIPPTKQRLAPAFEKLGSLVPAHGQYTYFNGSGAEPVSGGLRKRMAGETDSRVVSRTGGNSQRIASETGFRSGILLRSV